MLRVLVDKALCSGNGSACLAAFMIGVGQFEPSLEREFIDWMLCYQGVEVVNRVMRIAVVHRLFASSVEGVGAHALR